MKNSLLLFFLLFMGNVIGQNDHIQFDYDDAGNQIKRYVVDITDDRQTNQPIKAFEDLTDSDLIKADIYNDIKYYPNPVKEELYVKWENTKDNYVKSIEVYSMSGQLMKSYTDMVKFTSHAIGFSSYPQGFYNVKLVYANGENKTLKIVKH